MFEKIIIILIMSDCNRTELTCSHLMDLTRCSAARMSDPEIKCNPLPSKGMDSAAAAVEGGDADGGDCYPPPLLMSVSWSL